MKNTNTTQGREANQAARRSISDAINRGAVDHAVHVPVKNCGNPQPARPWDVSRGELTAGVAPIKPIPSELSAIDAALNSLTTEVEMLAKRIERVVGAGTRLPLDLAADGVEYPDDLAGDLTRIRRRIESATARLSRLNEGIQL